MRAWRRGLGAVASTVVAASVLAGCQTPTTTYEPPPCPYPEGTIQTNGDSLGLHLSRYLGHDLPETTVADRTEPRSGFTYALDAVPSEGLPPVPTIADAAKQWMAECGTPELLVIQGGINDLVGRGFSAEQIAPALVELSDWLREHDVPTLWVTVHPIAAAGNNLWIQPARQALNEWMTSGVLWGDVADCGHSIEDPARPDTLDPRYYEIVDLFGSVDGVHPNQTGYEVWASCISEAALDAIARRSSGGSGG